VPYAVPQSEITAVFAADEMEFELLDVSWVSEADEKRGGGAKTIFVSFSLTIVTITVTYNLRVHEGRF
jgi:hypothetical protein